MIKVRCFLPNASHMISDVAFLDCEDGGVESVDALTNEVASRFDGVPGYVLVPVPTSQPAKAPMKKSAA